MKTFKQIADQFNCDKANGHVYHEIYPLYIEQFRDKEFTLFEIGIDQGKSFELWKQYFPLAKIYGMDIGKEFKTDRGEVFKGDQSKLEDLKQVTDQIGKCELIIDDGSHFPEHQILTFEYLFNDVLTNNGVYIIEDTECSYWHPQRKIYDYPSGYLNLIDYFTKYNHKVNHQYNGFDNSLNIKTITFGPNCIIITKGDINDNEKNEWYMRQHYITQI